MSAPDPFADMEDWQPGLTKDRPAQPKVQPIVQPIKANGGEPPTTPQPAFPVIWIRDAEFSLETRPILKGLIEPGAFVVIYGPSGSGKSFFTADMAQHIATGAAWRSRRVRQSLVVYVASEAGSSILKRFVAWRDNRLGEAAADIPLAILTRGPNLLTSVDVEKLVDQLRALCGAVSLPLGLVVFDTLSRSIPGGDENTAEDMTMVVKAADILRDEFATATAYVHHSGKDATRGARGHTSLHAAADLVIQVDNHVATVEKVRDGVAGEQFPFALEVVELGYDADGDAVTTCLLNVADAGNIQQPKKPAIRGIAAVALQSLREEIAANGTLLPETSTIAKGVRAVQLDQWRERFRIRYGEDKDASVRAKAFWRSKDALLSASAIGISDPWVWIS